MASDSAQTPVAALRLTEATDGLSSAIIFARPQPTSAGLDISFEFAQWGSTSTFEADGLSFFLQKGTETSLLPGSLGGALGYSAEHAASKTGLPGGLIGVGFDLFGNFSSPVFGGSGCSDGSPATTPNALVIRGPGDGLTGYCRLGMVTSSATNWASGSKLTRASRARSARIVVDPATVSPRQVKVWVCAAGAPCETSGEPTLAVTAPQQLLDEPTVRFGFAAGTGAENNNHEIWNLRIGSRNVFPAAAITTPSLPAGDPGVPYSTTVSASGVAPFTFAVTGGSLPPGLSLHPTTGAITGTPTAMGTFTFTVEATDSRAASESGRAATRAYAVRIGPLPPPPPPSTTTTTTPGDVTPETTAVVAPTTAPPISSLPAVAPTSSLPGGILPETGPDESTTALALAVFVAAIGSMIVLLRRRHSLPPSR